MTAPIKMLLIDSDENNFYLMHLLLDRLHDHYYQLEWIDNYEDGLTALNTGKYDIYLVNYNLNRYNGSIFLKNAVKAGCNDPIIILSNRYNKKTDNQVMKAGAAGYLAKDELNGRLLEQTIRHALSYSQTLHALRNSESRYRQMFENNSAIKLILDPLTHEIIDANPAACSFYGYSLSEFLKKKITDINPLPSEVIGENLKIAMTEKKNYFIFQHRLASGELRTVEVHSNPIQFQNRQLLFSIIFDITERKKAETALKKSEERYRELVENAKDIIYVHDLQGNFLSINKAVKSVSGYTPKEVLKMNVKDVVVAEDLVMVQERIAAKLANGKRATYEARYRSKSGKLLTLEINSRLILKDGVPVAIQGVARNVTERVRHQEALRESEEKFRELFENANDIIYVHDLKGNFTSINRAIENVFGYTREQILKMTVGDLLRPEDIPYMRSIFKSILADDSKGPYEARYINKNGQPIWLEVNSRVVYKNGEPAAIQGVARDITHRYLAEEALVKSEERFRELFENANDIIFTRDMDGNFTSINHAGELVTGYTREELLKMNMWQVIAPEHHDAVRRKMALDGENQEPGEFELDIISKDNRRITLHLKTRVMPENGKSPEIQGIARDITERKITEERLRLNALYDKLTNLPNRANFMEHLQNAITRKETEPHFKFAVLFLDLDRFKVINDSLGHIIGDKLLIAIAEKLKACLRPADVVARLGGDEFTILLNDIGETADAVKTAERLQRELSVIFEIDNYEVFTSASIGIIVSDNIKRRPEDFLRDADTAMYRAKEGGKSRYEIFDREMHIRNVTLLKVETDLRRAIERNELRVFYQPIISFRTGKICEFEALIRWQHPEYGLLLPMEFIPVAEETGLITPIGRWILDEACRQTAEWQQKFNLYDQLSIAVNLSAKQLMQPTLTKYVSDALQKTGLAPENLNIEVTESSVMENSDIAFKALSELEKMGVKLSTDDFGTGYSSLSYLHNYPFGRLKIDRSFVGKMDTDPKTEEIVRTIIVLGRNLNIEVVAEGIETTLQLRQLMKLDCDFGQGFFFSKPVNAQIAENLLQTGFSNETSSLLSPVLNKQEAEKFIQVSNLQ